MHPGMTQVHEAFYSFVNPTSTGKTAKLVMLSSEVAARLGLDPADCQTEQFAAVMSGNAQLPGREGCEHELPPCLTSLQWPATSTRCLCSYYNPHHLKCATAWIVAQLASSVLRKQI